MRKMMTLIVALLPSMAFAQLPTTAVDLSDAEKYECARTSDSQKFLIAIGPAAFETCQTYGENSKQCLQPGKPESQLAISVYAISAQNGSGKLETTTRVYESSDKSIVTGAYRGAQEPTSTNFTMVIFDRPRNTLIAPKFYLQAEYVRPSGGGMNEYKCTLLK